MPTVKSEIAVCVDDHSGHSEDIGAALERTAPPGAIISTRLCPALESCSLCVGPQTNDAKHKDTLRRLRIALFLCTALMVIEIVGGIMANSIALMSDAVHMLADASGLAISLFTAWAARQRAADSHSFGYHRAEVLGALGSLFLLWASTAGLLVEAVRRIMNPVPINGKLMTGLAALGVINNGLLMLVLGFEHHHHGVGGHDCGHGHGHSHSHGEGVEEPLLGGGGKAKAGGEGKKKCSHGHNHSHDHGAEGHSHHSHGSDHSHHEGHEGHTHHEHSHLHDDHSHHSHGSDDSHHSHHGHSHDDHGAGSSQPKAGQPGHTHTHSHDSHDSHHHDDHHHDDSHHHDDHHDHDHHDHHSHGGHGGDLALRAAVIHVIGDSLQAVGVLLAAILIWWAQVHRPGDLRWNLADPIATILFSVFVAYTSYTVTRDITDILMERYPRHLSAGKIVSSLRAVPGVVSVHDLHVWSIVPGKTLLMSHVDADPKADIPEVLDAAERALRRLGIHHSTLQVEPVTRHALAVMEQAGRGGV